MQSSRRSAILLGRGLLLASILACTQGLGAAESWVRIRSPHFTVISNAGAGAARNVAWQFEQFRSAIETAWPWARVELDRPVIVVAGRDQPTMRILAPGFFENRSDVRLASYTASSFDAHYIALAADIRSLGQENTNPYQTAYRTYATLVLDAAFGQDLPFWFKRGFATVLSNTIVTSSDIQFGRPISSAIQQFKEGRFRLAEFLTMTPQAVAQLAPVERSRFDAQSWAVLEYLLYGSTGREQPTRVNELAQLLLAGTSSVEAVEKVFGSLDALDAAYQLYIGQGLFRYTSLKADVKVSSKAFLEEPLPPAKAVAARAAFHAATGRLHEALAGTAEIRKLDPVAAEAFEIEGKLFVRDQKAADAERAFARAAELNSENFYVYYRLASVGPGPNGGTGAPETRERWLTRSVELNERFAPAWATLANVRLQLQRPADAGDAARHAVQLRPDNAYYRLTLAQTLWQAGKQTQALDEARRALTAARNDEERRAAQSRIAGYEQRMR